MFVYMPIYVNIV